MWFACGSRLVDDLKVKRRFAGFASSLIWSERVSISVRGIIVVLVVLDVVVLATAVVDVIVDDVVVVAAKPRVELAAIRAAVLVAVDADTRPVAWRDARVGELLLRRAGQRA